MPETALKQITPDMSREAIIPPMVPPHMAKIDLACGRVTETVTLIKLRGRDGKERPLMRVGSSAYALSVALEQQGAHLGLTWKQLGKLLDENPDMVTGRANIRYAAARVSEVWERSHGVLLKWDYNGVFRIVRDREREMHAGRLSKFIRGAINNARRVIWGRVPDPQYQLDARIPLFEELESRPRGQLTD